MSVKTISPLTTHVLDTSRGLPAANLAVSLATLTRERKWHTIARGVTDEDGRIRGLLPSKSPIPPGTYRLTFDTDAYFRAIGVTGFYPNVTVVFAVREPARHLHVPLLLSPYGYSTYRGS